MDIIVAADFACLTLFVYRDTNEILVYSLFFSKKKLFREKWAWLMGVLFSESSVSNFGKGHSVGKISFGLVFIFALLTPRCPQIANKTSQTLTNEARKRQD